MPLKSELTIMIIHVYIFTVSVTARHNEYLKQYGQLSPNASGHTTRQYFTWQAVSSSSTC